MASSAEGLRARQMVVPGIIWILGRGNTSEKVLSRGNGSGSTMSVTTKPALVSARCPVPIGPMKVDLGLVSFFEDDRRPIEIALRDKESAFFRNRVERRHPRKRKQAAR